MNLTKPDKNMTIFQYKKPVKTCYLKVSDSKYLNLTKLNL